MPKNMKNDLFGEFPKVSKSEWIEQVTVDLKGKDVKSLINSKLTEAIHLAPFYTLEERDPNELIHAYKDTMNPVPEISGASPRFWSNVAAFDGRDEKNTNLQILEALRQGADALLLHLDGDEDLELLLKDVAPQYIEIYIKPRHEPLVVLGKFLEWIESVSVDKDAIKGGFLSDNFADSLTNKSHKPKVVRCSADLLELTKPYPNFKALCLDTAIYHNAGADAVQEIGFAVAAYIDLLDELIKLGYDPAFLIHNTFIKSAVGEDFFKEIAKLRVTRILFHQLSMLYDAELAPEDVFIYAETSFWTKSALDLETNMLRNTTEAMAAILGGCNAVHILRHDVAASRKSTPFAQRMALNISNLLKEEAYLDKHLDPVAGSYYLEKLISGLSAKVKDKLIQIENLGGWWVEYQLGIIQKEVLEVRKTKIQEIASGEITKVGVNKFLSPTDSDVLPLKLNQEQEYWQLFPSRASILAEKPKKTK